MPSAFVFFATSLCLFLVTACSNQKISDQGCYKGKLAVKALCSNYTIQLVEGNLASTSYEASWTDPSTGKNYSKAFALGNPCSFPSGLNEGDEFYFTVVPASDEQCTVCLAYYPKPEKKLMIKVLPQGCN